jgi:DNA-binding response OmpR family regulator
MYAILVAEDDSAIRRLLAVALGEHEGWAVTTVPDGSGLLQALDSLRPDLILLDVYMPGPDGIEAYRLLREREGLAQVPVLFVTVAARRVREARLDGPHDCLPKPFDLDDLLGRVEAMLGEQRRE